MSTKQKIRALGVGLIGVNVLAVILLAVWPNSHSGEEFDRGLDTKPGVAIRSILDNLNVYKEENLNKIIEIESKNATESAVAEVDNIAPSVYTEDTVLLDTVLPPSADTISVPVYREGTVLEMMREGKKNGTLTFEGREYPGLGFFVETVQSISPPEGRYWILYINGAPATLGVSRAKVQVGDVVDWRLEKDIYK